MRASFSLLAAAAVLSCRVTEVALVTVRNDTRADVAIRVRLPGNPTFRDDLMLQPADERTLLKYEEQKSAAQPLSSLVEGLQVVAGPCMGTLDTAGVAQAAVRTEHPRRWTILVTPAVLRATGCPSP